MVFFACQDLSNLIIRRKTGQPASDGLKHETCGKEDAWER